MLVYICLSDAEQIALLQLKLKRHTVALRCSLLVMLQLSILCLWVQDIWTAMTSCSTDNHTNASKAGSGREWSPCTCRSRKVNLGCHTGLPGGGSIGVMASAKSAAPLAPTLQNDSVSFCNRLHLQSICHRWVRPMTHHAHAVQCRQCEDNLGMNR